MKKDRRNTIYWVLIVLSIIIGIGVYGFLQDQMSLQFLILFSGVPFFLFVMGFFGLLWPAIKPVGDAVYISHAIIIGVLFVVLFLIHTWFILPRICPDFGKCLGV